MVKFHKIRTVSRLLYGSATRTVGDTGERSVQANEMRFIRTVSGCTRENKERNGGIRDKLNIFKVNYKA
jgi:hypothetical protein